MRNSKTRRLLFSPNPWRLHRVFFAKFKFAVVVTPFIGSTRGSFNDVMPFAKITFKRQSFDVFNRVLSEALNVQNRKQRKEAYMIQEELNIQRVVDYELDVSA
jgi:hypothetical protein